MAIPDSQLQTWSNQGATTSAQNTHTSIRNALSVYDWPEGVSYDTYLQGSYRNSTNIRRDSDVDLVAQLTSAFYSNLTEEEKRILCLGTVSYDWNDFRNEVIVALTDYYGSELIDTSGSKSIKVLPGSNRLRADVVVSATYGHYSNMRLVAEGMTFWTQPGREQIINYPKLHYSNGTGKNSQQRTGGWYKPTIRMYKNARNRIFSDRPDLEGRFPSYFLECLVYNVPDDRYGGGHANDYVNVLKWLASEFRNDRAGQFVCQNGMDYLFGSSTVRWNMSDAIAFVIEMIRLWDNW